MLRLGYDLVWHIFDISFNCYVAGLPSDFSIVCRICRLTILGTLILSLLEGFESDYGADGRVIPEPGVIADFFKTHALLWVRLQQLRDEVFRDS